MTTTIPPTDKALPRSLWALMMGNFVIGTGVMVVPGTLNDISTSLNVSIPQAGQLITAAAILMGLGAPAFATLVAGWDRRRLLTLSLVWYALLTGICALAPNYATLLPLRVLAVIAPAVFTPQAAASVGLLVSPAQRGRAITFVFLGWSVASVMGMPLSAWIGGTLGWRWAFGLVAAMSVVSAAWVWREMPNGIRPAALSRQAWGQTLGSAPLMLAVGVTLLSAFGQFTLFSYFAPYFFQTLGLGGGALSLMFLWFGAFGLAGNVGLSRWIDRIGAPRAVLLTLGAMVLTLLLWPLGQAGIWQQALVLVPWALGCFACNSAQQARLVHLSPALAPATVALNTSAMYGGQALGAALGGILIAQGHMLRLHQVGLVVLILAMALSVWAARKDRGQRLGAVRA
ncbi:MAG TPA: MFS transporter [Hydrogenophaga sp.]|jgi:predicted MFS family arabinose efflux permease|uniref:MFS transporter n=1 Tax=Hydrogenophaga sp. TaxID=1904254 RepID=UPI0008C824CF|nr:MFS transporter [Hydrogenophaga sp.]OGA75867.1 MAG: transporter [Burkholderiales bacterium GWE1_65_30]OGA90151.1 MAG: transporter [Burkholderiales bacterium GWF1_66_17]OGB29594.1 MAG: transporter [Burkholderiales bacterium RIFCSPLOWO2_02_FULL_66_35]HAX22049.1 MFS transporter [Hydrogenophaga sp.]HBU17487.1 MFS transporter [Hydrogenophaga sp.]